MVWLNCFRARRLECVEGWEGISRACTVICQVVNLYSKTGAARDILPSEAMPEAVIGNLFDQLKCVAKKEEQQEKNTIDEAENWFQLG